jgi:hypothetical protein
VPSGLVVTNDSKIVRSRRGDQGSAVRVADENRRTADAPERALDCGDVAYRVEAVLTGHHLVALRLKRGDDLAEADPSAQIPWTNTMRGLACEESFMRPSLRAITIPDRKG